jgi:phosphate starvation-inducible membrane PsiE
MKRKFKRHLFIPLLLLVYVAIMVVMAIPKYQESGNWNEFTLILAVSLLLIVVLYFIYKRKEKLRDKFNNRS